MRVWLRFSTLAVVSSLAAGCGSGNAEPNDSVSRIGALGADAGGDDAAEDDGSSNAEPTDDSDGRTGASGADDAGGGDDVAEDDFDGLMPVACNDRGEPLDGLTASGDGMELHVVEFEPAPPVIGDNSWLVELSVDDEPLAGVEADIVVSPRMPDHGHGSPVMVGVAEEMDGVYRLSPVNTFMPGYWEIELSIEAEDVDASVSFGVCIE